MTVAENGFQLVNEKGSGKRVKFLRLKELQVEFVLYHLIGANICHIFQDNDSENKFGVMPSQWTQMYLIKIKVIQIT